MKKYNKILSLLLVLSILISPFTGILNSNVAMAEGEESPFIFDAETGTITGYEGGNPPENLVIPAEIDGVAVKHIGYKAFFYSTYSGKITTQIKTLELPEGLEEIQGWAFQGNLLETLRLPNSLKVLNERAFSFNQLNEVELPEGLSIIGEDAFYNNKLKIVTIPNSVKEIGGSAFKENLIETVTLPEGLEKIGEQAFALNSIESITIPESVVGLPTKTNNGIVWRNFIDASLDRDNKVQRYTKVYNNSNTTDENTNGIVNPAEVTIKYVDGNEIEIKDSKTVVGKELKKLELTKEGYKTIENIVDGSNEYLTDYNTCINKHNVYKYMADLGPNYFRIGQTYTFEPEEIGGYKLPENQIVTLDQKENTVTFVYESAGNVNLTLEGEGLTSNVGPGEVGINADVEIKILPPFGKEIDTFTVNDVDKKEEIVFEELENIYRFKIAEDTSIKVTYKDADKTYEKELKLELDKESMVLGEEDNVKAFYRGALVNLPNEGITWTVDHEDIATIDSNTGEVTTLKSGTVVITALLKNRPEVKDTFTLTIQPFTAKVRVEANDHTIAPLAEVKIDDLDLTKYNITTEFTEPKPIHAIIKALESVGIDCADSVNGLDHGNGNYITMIDGLRTFSTGQMDGWMYYVDNGFANEGVGSFHIDDGQSIVVFFVEDYTKNTFSWFDNEELKTNAGTSVDLTLNGTLHDMWTNQTTEGPVEDATILVNNEEYKLNDEVVKTNAEGKASLTFNEAGTYIISAEKKNPETGKRILTRPYCKIVVEGEVGPTLRERVGSAIEDSIDVAIDNHFSMDWLAIGLARTGNGDKIPADYLQKVTSQLKDLAADEDNGKYVQPTDYERRVLGLLAVGGDPKDVDGINIIERIYNSAQMDAQGINAKIFGLIALDSGKYKTPKDAIWDREKLIEDILNLECTNAENDYGKKAGWAFAGNDADPDMTGMTMTALAPYNNAEHPEVQEAINRSVEWLSTVQDEKTGGFKSWGALNSQSCAQAIMGLCTNNIDPTEERFTKNNKNIVDALLDFETEEGGFGNRDNKNANGMSTEQALYSLAQYIYYLDDKGSIYQWGDLDYELPTYSFEATIDKAEYTIDEQIVVTGTVLKDEVGLADADVTLKVTKEGEIIPITVEQIKTDSEGKINHSLLLPEDTELGKYILTLKANEPVNELVNIPFTIEKSVDEEVEEVITKIEELPSVEEVTLENKTAVEEARAAYEALTEEQKALVPEEKLNKLAALEKKIKELEEPEQPEPVITIEDIQPTTDITLNPGEKLEVSFRSQANGKAYFRVLLPLTINAGYKGIEMTEVEEGYYKGEWIIPEGININSAYIEVEFVAESGKSIIELAQGKLTVETKEEPQEPEEPVEEFLPMADLPLNTVIVGNVAYDIRYLNSNSDAQIKLINWFNGKNPVYIKLNETTIVNIKGEIVNIEALEDEITYYDAVGNTKVYKK